MTNQKTEKQSPAEKLAWAAGNITMKYFQSDKVAMGKRLPTPSEMEDLQAALVAYRSAPKMPSPSYRLDRLLEAMEHYKYNPPDGHVQAEQTLSDLRKAAAEG